MVWIVMLTVFGLAFVVAEVFFPSMGVLSILSALCLVGAVVLGFKEGELVGYLVLATAAIGAPVTFCWALKILPNTPFGKSLVLDAGSLVSSNKAGQEVGLEDLLGKRGKALSPLRPAGFARLDGRRVDVVTRGNLIDQGEDIVVLEVEGNRVVVGRDGAGTPESSDKNT